MKIIAFIAPTFLISVVVAAQSGADTLHWSTGRSLQISDFKKAPQTYTGLSGEAFCMLMADFNRPNAFSKTQWRTSAVFDPSKSWMDPKTSGDPLLAYFQVTFDLYELHARKLRSTLESDKAGSDPSAYLSGAYNAQMSALTDDLDRLRMESLMGQDEQVVAEWEQRVRQEIGSLVRQ